MRGTSKGGAVLASSTPDALWAAPAARLVQAAAVACRDVGQGSLLQRCTFRVGRGVRLLVVAEPDESGSVLLRILAGLARPSTGRVTVAGIEDPSRARGGGRVSYLPPDPGIHGWMTPREAVGIAARLLDLDPDDAARRIESALRLVEIDPLDVDRPVGRGGPALLQRAGLAAALVGDPEVLLLDEPLRALVPDERSRLLKIPGRQRTIVLASRLPENERGLATHVMLLQPEGVMTLAPIGALEAAGLPLSRDGIRLYAGRHAPRPSASGRAGSAAATR
jgi:ABC-2 type transport system ATP-binding protein